MEDLTCYLRRGYTLNVGLPGLSAFTGGGGVGFVPSNNRYNGGLNTYWDFGQFGNNGLYGAGPLLQTPQ